MSQALIPLLVFTPLAFGTVQPWSIAAMELAAFGIFLLHLSRRGVALPEGRLERATLLAFSLLVGLVLLQLIPLPEFLLALISPTSRDLWRGIGGDPPGTLRTVSLYPDATRQELLKLLAYGAVFVVVVRECRTRDQIRSLVKVVFVMGGLLAIIAIAQKLAWNGRVFWVFPVSEAKRSGAGIWGPFINRNHFAGYQAMAVPLVLGWMLTLRRGADEFKRAGWRRRAARFVAGDGFAPFAGVFLIVVLMSATLIATRSRGGVTAWAGSMLCLLWLAWRRRSLRRRALACFLAVATIGAVALVPAWERVGQRFAELDDLEEVGRLHLWNDSLGIVREFPLFGSGLGTFGQAYRRHQTTSPRFYFDHAHNDYLELVTDMGGVGLLLAGALAGTFLLVVVRRWRRQHSRFSAAVGAGGIASCLAIALHSGVDFNLHIPANALLFSVIAGLTYAAVSLPNGHSRKGAASGAFVPDSLPGGPGLRSPLKWGVILLVGLLLYIPARDLLADQRYRRVERLLDDPGTSELDVKPITDDTIGSYLQAIESLTSAASLAPGRSIYLQALADLYARLGAWAEVMESLKVPLPPGALPGGEAQAQAVAAAKRAIFLEPTNPDLHMALGRFYAAEDGNLGRAGARIRLALAAHPASTPLRYSAALLYLQSGNKAEALEQALALARLDDSYLIEDSPRKAAVIARRTSGYLARLSSSYLFQAMEIAWRSTGSIETVKDLTPDNSDAAAVLAAFVEWKGLDG